MTVSEMQKRGQFHSILLGVRERSGLRRALESLNVVHFPGSNYFPSSETIANTKAAYWLL